MPARHFVSRSLVSRPFGYGTGWDKLAGGRSGMRAVPCGVKYSSWRKQLLVMAVFILSINCLFAQPLSVLITNTANATCNGYCDGSATATPSGGTAPYTYLWDDPFAQIDSIADSLCAGIYIVRVIDAVPDTIYDTVAINEPALLTATIMDSTNSTCFGLCNGMATVTPSGGTSPYTYQWDNLFAHTTAGAVGLCADTLYTVIVTDFNGCDTTAEVTLSQPQPLTSSITPVTNVSCNGLCDGSANVTLSGGTIPYSFQWMDSTFTPLIPAQTDSTATGLCAALYIVQISDTNGCFTISSTAIIEPPALTSAISDTLHVSCADTCDGSAVVTPSGGTLPYTFLWSDPLAQTDSTAANLCAGTYNATIIDANSCTDTSSVTITEPTILFIITNATCFGICDGIATAVSIGGTPPYTYLWDDPDAQTTSVATWLCADTYTVTVIDTNGCVVIDSVNIITPSTLVSMTNTSCNGICDGTATAEPSGGAAPYTYLWNDAISQTDSTATGLCPGPYTVTVTDANGCITIAPVIISEPDIIMSNITDFINVNCSGICDGSASLTASGGTAPYSYLWDDLLTQTDSIADSLCAGTYCVIVTDANGCTDTSCVTIIEPPLLTSSITDTVYTQCSGACDGMATATPSGGTPPYTNIWDDPQAQTDSTAANLCAGTYNVIITDNNGCMVVNTVDVTQPPVLTIGLSSTTPASCNGCDGSASVTISGGTLPYTYLWDPAAGGQTTPTADSLCASTYTVTVTDSNNCIETLAVAIASAGGLISTINNINASCNGVCDGEAIILVSGGVLPYTYAWDSLGIILSTETNSIITGLCAGAGDYTAVVTDNNGCITTAPVIITEPAIFISSITSSTDVTCNGLCDGTATVTPVGGTPPYTYNWLDDLLNPIGQAAPTADNLCAGTYNVVIDDANGCFAVSIITITEPPVLTSTITNSSNAVCGCDGSATATPSGGMAPYTYLWDDPLIQTVSTASGLCAGTYNIIITDANGCITTLAVAITAPGGWAAIIDTSIDVSCNGGCDGEAVVSAPGGVPPLTYAWMNLPADTIAGQTDSIIMGLCAGNYLAVVTDSGGCIATAPVTITEPPALTPVITDTTFVSCADTCDGSATVTPYGGTPPFTYLWDDLFTQTDSTATNLCFGTYNTIVTDANNCTNTSTVIITEPSVLILQTNATCLGICDGEAIAIPLGGTPPYNYLWNDPLTQTDSIATGLCAGTYTIIVNDANGCIVSGSITITFPTAHISQTNASCSNVCDGTATVEPAGGLTPYTYLWDPPVGGQTDSTATGLCAGYYNVTVTDANGCAVAGSIIIDADNASPIADAGNDVTICKGESTTLNASGGGSYIWSPPTGLSCTDCQSPVANPSSSIIYTVIVSNIACSDTDEITVTVEVCLAEIPQVITPNGDDANDIFKIYGIESFPKNKILIFNRWGNIVFSTNEYHNENNHWDGTSNNGSRLPDGTYFYILDLGDGAHPYTGFVMIHR
ncbi:MAG: gliding motility-associated C-terminal domain-containing protein [Bacteroidota bacterium]